MLKPRKTAKKAKISLEKERIKIKDPSLWKKRKKAWHSG